MTVCLPELFTRQAAATPDAVAVVAGDGELTYAELDLRVGRLAGALAREGCGEGSVVGVALRRGVDLAVTLQAVWRVGAAYVPLDPDQPASRTARFVAETGCETVVTADYLASLASLPDAPPLPAPAVPGDSAAYVLYTSGSTGRPKGVVVTHGGIANRVLWTVRTHGLAAGDRVLQKTSMSFDAAGWEIFAPLVSGGVVVMAPVGAERDPALMLDTVVRERVTVLQVVPSVLRQLVAEPRLRECTSLRLLFCAGEPLHAELCQQVWTQVPVELWNTYGPTECAIDVTAYRCDPAQTSGPVPIGAPISNAHVLVLDELGELTPIGLDGELYLGGPGVARGYLGQPALTAERFVPDPIGPPGSRLYRTGDRARWRPDGVLEYLGRLDDQFKINGVRIEPAEIEAVVRAHPDVRECAVLAVPDATGTKRLAAYVVGSDDLAVTEVRSFLRRSLPDHLVPTLLVPIAQLPSTSSGKVDRAALVALDAGALLDRPDYQAPSTAAERTVAQAWSELLGVERVGVDDDFFQLGGHSLLITRLAEWLRAASGRHLEVRHLFAASTVRAQAVLLSTKDVAEFVPAPPAREGRLPLSFGQQRVWFLEQLRRGDPEYIVPLFLRVPALVGTATVRRALDALAERHEVLRTRYVVRDGEPLQVVDPAGPVELRVVETDGVDDVGLLGAELSRGFDLERGPVWRAVLARRPDGDGVLLVTAHHIAVDGRSLVVLSEEFERLCAGDELPPPDSQYADHAIRQRHALTDELAGEQLAHWGAVLDGSHPVELPIDRPRAPERDSRGAALEFHLSPTSAAALLERGRAAGATPFMSLLTVFSILLMRYSRQWDVVIGTPVAGRDRPEVANVVGFFLNSLPLRVGLRPETTFTEALGLVRSVCTAAFANSDVPFERLVELTTTERDLSRTPVYQVIFDLHEEGLAATNADSVDAETMRAIWRTAKTDLSLIVRKHDDGRLDGIIEYATALFDESTARRLADSFTRLVDTLTAAPDRPVSGADILTADERHRLVRLYNDTATRAPQAPVHELVAARAALAPDAVALVTDDGVTTFGELDARANRFARMLLARGTGAESVVGVLLDRSPDLVACLLGVWKAGAAYVPLDPSFPADRIGYTLADAGAEVLMTQASLAPSAVDFPGATVLLDRDHAELDAHPGTPPDVAVDMDQLAYVIYTSGSTGRPKGVAVPHRGLANYLLWTIDAYAGHTTGGAPVFTSIAFDLGMPNLFTPLLTGAPARLFPQDLDLTTLGARLADAGPFGFVKLAPAQLELVLHQLSDRPPTPLAELVCAAGDWVAAGLVDRWRTVTGQADGRFAAEYGPTEITVGNSVFHAPGPEAPPAGEFLSIGRPIPNTTMYVLDENLVPVPTGVVGEIHVGGAGVARGYVGKPALTAEKFVPDPFGEPGARLYRTGDLGRVSPDGSVEFRGRADNQVKVRGYRVELGEVEAALLAHPDIREAVVILDDREPGEKRLVAYHVGGEGGLREFLATTLPTHQIPDVFLALESLPLTANGKVDHKGLPKPGRAVVGEPTRAPETVLEKRIADIFAGVLGVTVGVDDGFFQLGGHSLSAAKAVSMIEREFDVVIGMRTLFDRPTVAGLAGAVEDAIRAEIDALSATEVAARAQDGSNEEQQR